MRKNRSEMNQIGMTYLQIKHSWSWCFRDILFAGNLEESVELDTEGQFCA